MKKTTHLSRNRSLLTNLLIRKKKINVKRELRFIDSLRFMACSLDKLSSNLKIDQFVNLKKYFIGNQSSLLLRKGVYPYDYVDSMRKLKKQAFLQRKPLILNSQIKVLQTKTTSMLKLFGRNLILSR